jgi:GxxExxY protein
MLRIESTLPEETETVLTSIVGCCIAVHRHMGPGFLEVIYAKAVARELRVAGIEFEREHRFPVIYRGELLCEQRLDFIVGNRVVVEIKAVDQLASVHHAQLLSYMRVAQMRAGLLVNFNVAVLRDGLKRKVL